MDRLPKHTAGLGPKLQNHLAQVLRKAGLGAGKKPSLLGKIPLGKEIYHTKEAKPHDKIPKKPIDQIQCDHRGKGKGEEIKRYDTGQHPRIRGKNRRDPTDKGKGNQKRQRPIERTQTRRPVQRQQSDQEGEHNRQANNQPRGANKIPLKRAIGGPKAVFTQ